MAERTRNVTFEARLFCFTAYRTRTLHLKRTNFLENRGLRDRGEMTWRRSDRLPLKVIICLSMGLPNWIMQTTLTIVTVI